ncbi:GNAT family N-acetyltransferase [Fodinicurvata halophila]|uniref:GNAT family N-acetyltransferase n=1 Tax=Fodinicurvata halophila TaxID=1419723 RepID=A0ABV8UFA8_9PROT
MQESPVHNRDDSDAYAFRPVQRSDMPMLGHWLRLPQVSRWWGDPAEQLSLLASDLDEPGMVMNLVTFQGRPYAYIQDYAIHRWPQPHLTALPQGSRGLDCFIGRPEMFGGGHGSAFLRRRAIQLRATGAPTVAIDPDVRNLRARRACLAAGFRSRGEVDTDEGRACLLVFDG